MNSCPCGSALDYQECCQPLHSEQIIASKPEQLMASRYCAFVKGQAKYLLATHHPDFVGGLTELELAKACKETQWRQLEIIDVSITAADGAEVEFKAWYQQTDGLHALHERSRFRKEQGRWYYCDGQINQQHNKPKRNEPCPCGSGKKFKRCCG